MRFLQVERFLIHLERWLTGAIAMVSGSDGNKVACG